MCMHGEVIMIGLKNWRAEKESYFRFFCSKYSFILSSLIFFNISFLRVSGRVWLGSWSDSEKSEKSEGCCARRGSFVDLSLTRSIM